ncbi:hypothetical protein [Thalassotalea aquiviva]|uniref:hypothetical protein n=1 Tax=Thalassotalea aquiviva TaxID=3242415 RepID=UPI00352BB2D9
MLKNKKKNGIAQLKTNEFDWIEKNSKQLQWLYNYLRNKIPLSGHVTSHNSALREQIIYDIESAYPGIERKEFLKKARASWNQYKRRNTLKGKYRPVSIEMDNELYKRVRYIAQKANCPITEAIDALLKVGCEAAEDKLRIYNMHKHSQKYSKNKVKDSFSL